jgi:hypothetical protein
MMSRTLSIDPRRVLWRRSQAAWCRRRAEDQSHHCGGSGRASASRQEGRGGAEDGRSVPQMGHRFNLDKSAGPALSKSGEREAAQASRQGLGRRLRWALSYRRVATYLNEALEQP